MLDKFQCLKILTGTIDIRSPLACLPSEIQIQHGIHIIQTESVHMKFIQPEKRIGQQKISHHRASVIIKHGSPHRMHSHSRILHFIKRCSVKLLKSCIKTRELCRCPVKYHTDPGLMEFLHKYAEILYCTKTCCHRIVCRSRITT